MTSANITTIRRKALSLRNWFTTRLKRQQKVMVDGVVVEGEYEEKWSYANILNLIFLIAGFTLGSALVAVGFALLPFTFGSSSVLAGIGIKLLVVLSTGLSLASVGKNFGRVIDTFADKTKKTAEKVFAVIGCVLGVGVSIALACAPILHMTFPFISNTANLVFTRFSQILASLTFIGTLTSIGNKIGGSIDTIKNAILGLKDSNVSMTTRLGNLIGCFTGLIISITLLALHQKLAFFSVPVPNEWIQTAVTALNIYMCAGMIGRIGKHIGGAVNIVCDRSRSVLEKVATVAWLGISIGVTAVLARFVPLGQLRNGFVVVTKAISLLEVKAFFTVNFTGTLISLGNKLGGAVDTCKKIGSSIRNWFTAKQTATASNAQATPNNKILSQQIVVRQRIFPAANRRPMPTMVVRQFLTVIRNPASFRRNIGIFLTAGFTLATSILSPVTFAGPRMNNVPNQLEARQDLSSKKGEDAAGAVNLVQSNGVQNSPVPVPGHVHNKNGTQQEERNDVRQEEDENGNSEADNSSNKIITPNQANHKVMQAEIDGGKKADKGNKEQKNLQQYFEGRQKILGKMIAKQRPSTMTEPMFNKQMKDSGKNADMDQANFYKNRRNTL